jgi:hypothetical protein
VNRLLFLLLSMTKLVPLHNSSHSGSTRNSPLNLNPPPSVKNNNRGIAPLLVVGYIAVVGLLGFLAFKPKFLDKASKTAAASTVATADVNTAHGEEVRALKAKSASAAAGVAVVNQVAGTLPDTPARSAIVSEASIVQSKLEAPDPVEQLAAERRANAILTGNLEEARRLNALAYQDSASLRDRTIAAEAKSVKAEATRDAIDQKLGEAAAKALGAENASNRWKIALVAVALLYLWTKFSHLSYGSVAEIAADIKKGKDGLAALDSGTSRFQQKLSRIWGSIFHPSS